MYNYGLAPQQINRAPAMDQNIIGPNNQQAKYPTFMPSSSPMPTGVNPQNYGAIQAPNAVLQNITDYSGSMGTLGGHANRERGLANYASFNQQQGLGNVGGQTTPWGLRNAAEGGADNPYTQYDYFVGTGYRPQSVGLGSTYDFSGGGIRQRENLRDLYSGNVVGYGDEQFVSGFGNPLAGKFASQTPVAYDPRNVSQLSGALNRGAMNAEIEQLLADYLARAKGLGTGRFDVNEVNPTMAQLNQQFNRVPYAPTYSGIVGMNQPKPKVNPSQVQTSTMTPGWVFQR